MLQRTNNQWISALRGPERDEAILDLRALLIRSLRSALSRQSGVSDAAIEDFAQEALIKILDNLDSFRGESRFTTWSQKIAVRVAFTELRRKEWRNVSLQDITDRYDTGGSHEAREVADPQTDPEDLATQQVMIDTVRRLIYEELTERQREAIVAVMLNGMPLEEAARRMETNRNALYKLLYDARKRLKKCLISEGISARDALVMFGGK